ncbi:unnamed protein product [Penicillium glandicola]
MDSPVHAKNDTMRPLTGDTLALTNLKDRRVLLFWSLEITGIIQFFLWLIVAINVAAIPVSFGSLTAQFIQEPEFSSSSNATIFHDFSHENNAPLAQDSLKQVSIDIWFALSFAVTMDAFAVVFTFNRALIRKFHSAVSQRLMFLASMLSWAFWSWNEGKMAFAARHPVLSFALGLAIYMFLGYALDKFENPTLSPGAASRRGTFAQYSRELGQSEISWRRAAFLATIVGGLGLLLTRLISSPWSAALPVIHILLESVVLSMMNARRTPRYISLSSPPFFAVVCVHWGVSPLIKSPCLSITPSLFLALVLLSRLLLDAHLWTAFRTRSELHWSRKNVLISTPRLLKMCIVMLLLENMGVKIITYIKPIAVLVFFGLGSTGYMGAAAYDIAAKL